MATDAPRPVPPYDRGSVANAWWYCLHCRHHQLKEHGIRYHVKSMHLHGDDCEPIHGEDYTNGDHLKVMLRRWSEWSLLAVDRFANALSAVEGADDFAFEVGDGVPDA